MIDLLRTNVPRLQDLLSEALMARLHALGRTVRYNDEQMVHQRGDARPGLSIVRGGRVKAGILGRDGSFLISSIIGPGHCYGEFTLFAGLPRTHDISAHGPAEVDQIDGRSFLALFDREPALSRALLTIAVVRHHVLLEFLDNLRRLPLPARVASLLLNGARGSSYRVDCRHDELAFTLGVTRVSIGAALKKLQAQDLIMTGYGFVEVPDTKRLHDWLAERSVVTPLVPKFG